MTKGILALVMTAALAVILAGCGGGGGSGNNSGSASGNTSSGATGAAYSGQSSSTGSAGGTSSYASTSASTSAGGAAAARQGGATVSVAKNSKLGKILVGKNGLSLYLFEADTNGKSACSSACTQVWPPLTGQGKPAAGKGVSASKLGTITRKDGSTQVTYNGHPLYRYAPDSKPGDTKGQGLKQFGAEWYVLSPSGEKVEQKGGS